ncbi:MAG: endonuclease/exonuclease/phosphatase family protein [Phycisphaerales bacterium]
MTFAAWAWVAVIWLVALSRFVGDAAWAIDLVATVSYFVAAPALLTAVVAALMRRWSLTLASLAASITALWPVTPQFIPASASAPAADDIRLLLCNIHSDLDAADHLAEIVNRESIDLVVLIESDMAISRAIVDREGFQSRLPFAQAPVRGMQWPILIMSRWPIRTIEFDADEDTRRDFQGLFGFRRTVFIESEPHGRFVLSATHPPSPRSAETWREGNDTVRQMTIMTRRFLEPLGYPIVIAGDFNSTPSGYRYRMMVESTELHSAAGAGSLLSGTWPADAPGALRLALDQVWGSKEIVFTARRALEPVGSDHRPLLVSFRVEHGG